VCRTRTPDAEHDAAPPYTISSVARPLADEVSTWRADPQRQADRSRGRDARQAVVDRGALRRDQQLIIVGKERGYLLFDEINDLLPAEIASSEELDELFNSLGNAGIEVVEKPTVNRRRLTRQTSERGEATCRGAQPEGRHAVSD